MPRSREVARQRARAYRAARASVAQEEEIARRGQLSRVLATAHAVVSDPDFSVLAARQNAAWAPKRLFVAPASCRSENGLDAAEAVLDFVVAWKFFFPVIQNGEIRVYLDKRFPGFVEEFKDTFIGLVMKGPFIGERRPAISRGAFE